MSFCVKTFLPLAVVILLMVQRGDAMHGSNRVVSCFDSPLLDEIADGCAQNITDNDIRNVSDWEGVCRTVFENYDCIRTHSSCSGRKADTLLPTRSLCLYDENICNYQSSTLNLTIQAMLNDAEFNQAQIDSVDVSQCLRLMNSVNPTNQAKVAVHALSCMRDMIDNGGLTGVNNKLARLMAQFLIDCTALAKDLGPSGTFYNFAAKPRCNMISWGDPHIETCNDDNKQTTCGTLGLQTYLDIFFLKITALDTVYTPPAAVTVMTELTIEFKSLFPPHDVTAIYKAVAKDDLPTRLVYLVNGLAAVDAVTLEVTSNGIELSWSHTGVVIQISHWKNRYLNIGLRAAKEVMNTGTGILIQGCPSGAVLDRRRRRSIFGLNKRDEDAASAQTACLGHRIAAGTSYMDACVYDVVTSNDPTIARATAIAIEDKERAVSRDEQVIRQAGVWSIDHTPTGLHCIDGAEVAGCRDCVPNEFLLDPTDCSNYYHCLITRKALLRRCSPSILQFNLAEQRCDWPWNVRCQIGTSSG